MSHHHCWRRWSGLKTAWTTDNTCSYSNVISNGGIPAVAYNVACHGDCWSVDNMYTSPKRSHAQCLCGRPPQRYRLRQVHNPRGSSGTFRLWRCGSKQDQWAVSVPCLRDTSPWWWNSRSRTGTHSRTMASASAAAMAAVVSDSVLPMPLRGPAHARLFR